MTRGKCALCNKNSDLKKSHIVPKFVSKWLKKTSATGFMRGVKEPKMRLQDLPKLPLLCGDCEQLFSKLESYFASNFFHPILNRQEKEVCYDENLQRFIISLNWRTLVTAYSDQMKVHPWIEQHLRTAEECWRKYLDGSAQEKIVNAIEKEPEKFLKSESFVVMLEESKRKRLKRIEKLPESIKGLIDIIDRSVDNPSLDTMQQKWVDYNQHIVADALSRIPLDKAQIINALLTSTISLANDRNRVTECEFETEELIVKFMVTLCETKNHQRKLLTQKVNHLRKRKQPDDQRIIVVFTFNPWDQEMPFETGYYVN